MELNEIIAVAVGHKRSNPKCPFCPKETPPTFTTHPGSANNSGTLEKIMEDPDQLVPEQSNARPKQGKKEQQSKSKKQPKPNPIYKNRTHGAYSCEAHHLISGKQALEAEKTFEKWIVAGSKIEADTGYSVNNADNGLWCPSIPEMYKSGKWGKMDPDDKTEIARFAMEQGLPQFHKGHHAISDPYDKGKLKHQTYDGYLKKMLGLMSQRMGEWVQKCFLCDKGKKAKNQPSVRVNQVLDNLSEHMRGKISPPRRKWNVFLSKYALAYHRPVCPHGVKRR